MIDQYRKLMYGALLHDIGKLIQRAHVGNGTHSELGWNYLIDVIGDEEIANCARYHHGNEIKNANLPDDSFAYIVYEADNISAGIDRRIYEAGDKGFNPSMPLSSIFNLFRYKSSVHETAYDLVSLRDDEKINFPVDPKRIAVTDMKYKYIYDDFNQAMKRMYFQQDSIESLLKLLEKTLCYVPSSTNTFEVADVSLFNHSKITAMIAGCMIRYFEEKELKDYKRLCLNENNRDKSMFLLVSGELSGIQNFLYTISSKGALKTLRGRSFYLEMLSEHLIDEILSELELSRTNLLYSGGGHFYLVLPNTEKTRLVLEKTKDIVNDWLIKEYSAELYFEMSFVESNSNWLANDLSLKVKEKNYLGELFKRVSENNSKSKLRRYSKEQLKHIMQPKALKDYTRECTICGTSSSHLAEFRDNIVCDHCKGMYALGERLPKLDSEVVIIGDITNNGSGIAMPSIGKNKTFMVIDTMESAIKLLEAKKSIRVYSVNNPLTGSEYIQDIWAGTYSVKGQSDGMIELEELAKTSKGIERLGVLRADVDDLGKGFINGFEQIGSQDRFQYISLSRNAALSYNLSIFFKHEINKICRGSSSLKQFSLDGQMHEPRNRNVTIVYSGGDDIFIVGAWNEILELAVDINNAFRKFTNNKMTLSAGVGIFKHDFPINQMAAISGELESVAKSNGKDRIVLFGTEDDQNQHTYTWDEFTDEVITNKFMKLKDWFEFSDEVNSKEKLRLGSSMLYKLLGLMKSIYYGEDKINLARIAYTIARLEPEDSKLMDVYKVFKTSLYGWLLNKKDLKEAITAMNFIVYLNREGEEKYGK